MRNVGRWINAALKPLGLRMSRVDNEVVPADLDPAFRPFYERARPYTMTGVEPMYALYQAVRHISLHRIDGDVVECGVWKGGSSMLAAWTLAACGNDDRTLYLYDTFAGMTEPTDRDRDIGTQEEIHAKWRQSQHDDVNLWCYSPLDEVKSNMISTGYPEARMRFVKGRVEETIPAVVPEKIALLRLDTDWYESTYHEMVHLFPRLAVGGVLLVDDYGQWAGAREAVDQYVIEQGLDILLVRLPGGACIGVKQRSANG